MVFDHKHILLILRGDRTVKEVADRIGINPVYYWEIECNRKVPSVEVQEYIVEVLDPKRKYHKEIKRFFGEGKINLIKRKIEKLYMKIDKIRKEIE